MLSIIFHLALAVALLWYQRKQEDRPRPIALTAVWEVVSIALALIESFVLNGTWRSGLLLQSLVVGIFYLPAVYLTFRISRRRRLPLWLASLLFLVLAGFASLIAAMFLAYVPTVQAWSP